MNITSISLSYMFFAISAVEFIVFLYYKFLVINTDPKSKTRKKIVGSMKDPDHWRHRNNIVAFISLFWALVSMAAFIYLKFFYTSGLASIVYIFIYVVLIVLSVALFIKQNKLVRTK
ncbi:hypothetical protein LGK95_02495 [Clostridium algoriphilum]|uniref:hypothetical protein n=1 Tax=Clostridium algoriphilum TaxID=198347 RepID=UPI001CF1D361|nr:hypothetical protein [Clostridium algoriphilum]MCB2292408.1 hypothetical protein [Clostridium algoriphilum]